MDLTGNKKLIYTGAVVLVAVIIFIFFRSGGSPVVKNYPSSGIDIIAFGDSLVFGTGATKPENNFVSVLSKKLNLPIVNLGVPGNTTTDGLARISDLDKYNPKIVLLLLGGNDRLRRFPEEQSIANLTSIIENIQNRGAIVVLLGVRGNLLGNSFEKQLEKLAEKYQTAYVSDVLGGLFGNSKYMFDTIHPNDAGNAVIADRIYPVILKLLN